MEATPEQVGKVVQLLSDRNDRATGAPPPRTVIQAVLSLGVDLEAGMGARRADSNGTEWRAVGVGAQGLVVVKASSDLEDWSLRTGGDGEVTVEARHYPLDEVVGTGTWLVEDHTDDDFDSGWTWRAGRLIHLRSGDVVRVPPFGDRLDSIQSKRVEALMAALAAHL